MILRLFLHNFRLYENLSLEFTGGTTVLFGPNGTGKTSVLEAISFLSSLRSFRTNRTAELIREGAPRALVEATLLNNRKLRLEFAPRRKEFEVDGKRCRSAAAFSRHLPTVVLAPEHHRLFGGPSETRRNYIDRLIYMVRPESLPTLQRYRRALDRKRRLLRAELPFPAFLDQVEPWNTMLAEEGAKIRVLRTEMIGRVGALAAREFEGISSGRSALGLQYKIKDGTEPLSQALVRNARVEHASKRPLIGPHRDDLHMLIDEKPLQERASQGERSSALLSLTFAEASLIQSDRGDAPLLLLDDVGATLDPERKNRVFLRIGDFSQVLLSTADPAIHDDAQRLKTSPFQSRRWG